jgi:hypothetical protein
VTALSPLILGKVKPLRKTKADSLCLSVCTSFIYTTTTIHQGWSLFYRHKDTEGFPFYIRYTSWTPHSHSRKPQLNSTYPPNPVFEVCAFRTYIDISYITLVSLIPITISINDSVILPSLLCSGYHHSNIHWITSLRPSRPSLRAWTRKGSLHPSAK